MTKAVIFDIDGTLADLSHRLSHIRKEPKDWTSFFMDVKKDSPKMDIISLFQMLDFYRNSDDEDKDLLLVSGRPEKTREDTHNWMEEHGIAYDCLYMRPDDDHRADYIIKSQILDKILEDGYEILFVVDDRQQCVDMWRERGITCLQCQQWNEKPEYEYGLLSLMVGPAGAGKTSWLERAIDNTNEEYEKYGITNHQIVASDRLRQELCGDFRDQSKNEQVFAALHSVVQSRIEHGLPCVVDATNIRNKDRLAIVDLAKGNPVRYFVIDRPLEEKRKTGGWRNEIPSVDLIGKHDNIFKSNLKDILAGDNRSNVTVIDLRSAE